MLDYKDIITKHYALGMSGMAIAKSLNVSPSGVNDFLRAFKACDKLDYTLPQGITILASNSRTMRLLRRTCLPGRT